MTSPRRLLTALALTTATVLLAGCSGSVSVSAGAKAVSAERLEQSIRDNVTIDGGEGDVEDAGIEITCAEDLPAEVDATVDCVGTDEAGGRTGFRTTVSSVDGTDVQFDSQLFLPGEEVATQVGRMLEEQGYALASMECEEALGEVGSTSGCTARVDGAAEPDELVITVNEIDGLRFRIGFRVAD